MMEQRIHERAPRMPRRRNRAAIWRWAKPSHSFRPATGNPAALTRTGAACTCRNYEEFHKIMDELAASAEKRQEIRVILDGFLERHLGASARITQSIRSAMA